MKHIKTFEELKFDTYYNAGKKLKSMAKKPNSREFDKTNTHYKRGVEIQKWAYTKDYREYGTIRISDKKGNVRDGLIASLHVDPLNFYEGFIWEEGRPEDGHITLFVQVYDTQMEETNDICYISIPLIWRGDKFAISGEPTVDFDELHLVDRQSAMKVRKALQEGKWLEDLTLDPKSDNYDENLDIKHQFMLHSTADEYEKMISIFKNISVNKLYK